MAKSVVSLKVSRETDMILEGLKFQARQVIAEKGGKKGRVYKDDIILFALKECARDVHKKAFSEFVMSRVESR